jgi:hypothetical protein
VHCPVNGKKDWGAFAYFAYMYGTPLGISLNTRTQDESKRPSISSRDPSETPQKKTETQTAHSNNNNGNLRYPNPIINPVPALCIQSQKYQ